MTPARRQHKPHLAKEIAAIIKAGLFPHLVQRPDGSFELTGLNRQQLSHRQDEEDRKPGLLVVKPFPRKPIRYFERWGTFTIVCPAFDLIDFPGVVRAEGHQTALNMLIPWGEAAYLMDLIQSTDGAIAIMEHGGIPRVGRGFEIAGEHDDKIHVRFL